MPTLAEIKARKSEATSKRPRKTLTVTLAEGQHLADEAQRLDNERMDLLTQSRGVDEDGERTGPPRKAGEGGGISTRLDQIREQGATIQDRMADLQGEVTIQGREVGDWLNWCTEHPARVGEDGKVVRVDLQLTGGECNANDLLADLGTYVIEWDGEALGPGDWDAIDLISGDYPALVTEVVRLHEARFNRIPKSSTASSATANGGGDSNSPGNSESAKDAS